MSNVKRIISLVKIVNRQLVEMDEIDLSYHLSVVENMLLDLMILDEFKKSIERSVNNEEGND